MKMASSFVIGSSKIPLELQHRGIFSIPWLKKSGVVCENSDDSRKYNSYSSSFPVKYVPQKKSSSTTQQESSVPVPVNGLDLDDKFTTNTNTSSIMIVKFGGAGARRNVQSSTTLTANKFTSDPDLKEQIDHKSRIMDYEFMEEEPEEEIVEEFQIHHENHHHELSASQVSKSKEDAEKLAIEFLATRAYTAVELRKKLQRKKFSLEVIETVIVDFQSRGLINDCLYAEIFSRSRWSSSTWGPRRIKQALLKKGVNEVDIEKAMKLVFQEGESGGDEDLRHGLSTISMDRLYAQASKQWLRSQDVPQETRKSRIIRWLQYRGFNWGIISVMVKRLESQYPH